MTPLFPSGALRAPRRVATRWCCGFDFDGTLAPIAPQPEAARCARARGGCSAACASSPPARSSPGAPEPTSTRGWRGPGCAAVVGNHGLEPGAAGRTEERRVHAWARALAPLALRFPGLVIEDKRYSLGVHLRHVRHKRAAGAALRRALRSMGPVHELPGKQVVNLLPSSVPHKGDALLRLLAELGAETAIYVGDDTTDEQVFALGDTAAILPVRVGRKTGSRAQYYVERQRDVDGLLALLARELRGHRPRRG